MVVAAAVMTAGMTLLMMVIVVAAAMVAAGMALAMVMVVAAVYAHGVLPFLKAQANGEFSFPVLFYIIVFAVVMAIGAYVKRPRGARLSD